MMKILNGKAFTLIELLVVISIIGILAVLLMANFAGTRERARDTQRKSDLRMIMTALNSYYSSCGFYPDQNGVTDMRIKGSGTCSTSTLTDWGMQWTMGGTVYMKQLPADPSDSPRTYRYTSADNDSFKISTCLENKSDEGGADSVARCGPSGIDCSALGGNEYVVCED